MPALFAPTSRFTLSVSNSTNTSPTLTESPSFLCQRDTVASSTDSPNSGTKILVVISTFLLDHALSLRLLLKIKCLLDQRLLIDSIQRRGAFRWTGTFRSAHIM